MKKIGWVIIVLVIILLITSLIVGIAQTIENENNRITEGIVVDKRYNPAHTTYRTQKAGNRVISVPEYHAETCQMCIEGKKNGETVQYWFSCPAEEWNSYKIGDYYKR